MDAKNKKFGSSICLVFDSCFDCLECLVRKKLKNLPRYFKVGGRIWDIIENAICELGDIHKEREWVLDDSEGRWVNVWLRCNWLGWGQLSFKEKVLKHIWQRPDSDWVKLNFDGATKGNPWKAGGGGVFKDAEGQLVGLYSYDFRIESNNLSEARAML